MVDSLWSKKWWRHSVNLTRAKLGGTIVWTYVEPYRNWLELVAAPEETILDT